MGNPEFDFEFMGNSTRNPLENMPKKEGKIVFEDNTTNKKEEKKEVTVTLSDKEVEKLAEELNRALDEYRREQEEKRRKETEETLNAIRKNLEELKRRLPQKLNFVFANGMNLFQGVRIMLPSFYGYGYGMYIVSACVSYEGKEYVIFRPEYVNLYTVCYASNGMLFQEMNMNVSNAILNYCTSQYWLV